MFFFHFFNDNPSITFFLNFQNLVGALARTVMMGKPHVPLTLNLLHLLPEEVRLHA